MMQTQLQTPYYVIEKNMLDELLTSLKDSLNRHWSNSIIGYSYKTNALPWVISYFNNRGCFAEVVSDSEYALGGKIGVPKGHFIYNGPIKTKESFLQALHDGAIVNIDSWREIDWLDEIVDGLLEAGIQPWISLSFGNKL